MQDGSTHKIKQFERSRKKKLIKEAVKGKKAWMGNGRGVNIRAFSVKNGAEEKFDGVRPASQFLPFLGLVSYHGWLLPFSCSLFASRAFPFLSV